MKEKYIKYTVVTGLVLLASYGIFRIFFPRYSAAELAAKMQRENELKNQQIKDQENA